ncbi:MAG: response regulator [Patescibacteria group bacterium]
MPYSIAIIEDETILRDVLVSKFTSEGFTVRSAADGAAGLELLRTQQHDVVLLDIVMPVLNGYDVLTALRAENKPLPPIIIISNSGQGVEIDKAASLGARDYIIKAKITPEEVVTKVRQVLRLPEAPAAPTPTPSAAVNPSVVDANGVRILLVEDDQFLRELMTTKLKREGFDVHVAVDGREGLLKIQTVKPDIVLLDVILPGLDGFNVLQQVRASGDNVVSQVPIVLLSNLGQDSDVQKGKSLGANDYLIKSNLTIDEIIKKIHRFLPGQGKT